MANQINTNLSLQLDTQDAKKELEKFKADVSKKPVDLSSSFNTDSLLLKTKKEISRIIAGVQNTITQVTTVDIALRLDSKAIPTIPDSLRKSVKSISQEVSSLSHQLKTLRTDLAASDTSQPLANLSHGFQSMSINMDKSEESAADFVKKLVNIKEMFSIVAKDMMGNNLLKDTGRLKGESQIINMPCLAKYACTSESRSGMFYSGSIEVSLNIS